MSKESVFRVLDALGCNQREPDRWTLVHCPMPDHGKGRGDHNPSLGVKLGAKGVVLNCFAGCHSWAIVVFTGFEMRDLFYEPNWLPRHNLHDLLARYERGDLRPEPLWPDCDTRDGIDTRDCIDTRDGTHTPTVSSVVGSYRSAVEGLGKTARAVFDDMVLLWGLNAAVGETRPLPYSVRFCADRMGWGDSRAAITRTSRALNALGKMQPPRIVCAAELQPRSKAFGTKCYLPATGWMLRNVDSENGATAINLDEPFNGAASEDTTRLEVRRAIRQSLGVA